MTSKSRLKLALETINSSGKINSKTLENLNEAEKNLVQTLFDQGLILESLNYIEVIDSETDWKTVKKELIKPKKKIFPLWKSVIRYAAVFASLFAISYTLLNKKSINVDYQVSEKNEIKLLLGNDKIKIVNQGVSQDISNSSGDVIAQQQGNTIKYLKDLEIDELVFHELDIPYGKILDVVLSDGTIVHLNSGTKMRYPVKFLKGKKRQVFIEGQAYFEVAKDKEHPFIVNADAVAIEVLGTKFDISTYHEDSEIKTVLVEGSVSMSNSFVPKDAVILTPGTKGSWHKTEHQTKVEEVDVNTYMGWMKGELIFRNTTFEKMKIKLERKYNVQIINNNAALANKVLNASFSENIETIEDVLKYIKEIYPFHYEISDNKILIY